jgi:hypothetical protein
MKIYSNNYINYTQMATLAQSLDFTFRPESSVLPPINALRLTRNNAHYITPYDPEEILERSLSSSFVWPTGTVTFTTFNTTQPIQSH